MGETIEEVRVVEKIMRSLHFRFDYISLFPWRKKLEEGKSIEQALQANYSHKKDGSERGGYHRGRGRRGGRGNHWDEQSSNHADDSEGNGRRSNEARGRGRGRGRQGRYAKSQIPGYLCQRFVHDFYDSRYNNNNKEVRRLILLMMRSWVTDQPVFLMSYNETEPPQSVTWFLDSGASNPMEGRKEFFARLDEGQQGKQDQIWWSIAKCPPIKGREEKVMSSSKKGTSYFGCLLYYVPDIKSNFLSIGQWREDMTSRSVIYLALSLLDKKSKQITHVKMTKNRMLPLKLSIMESRCMKATTLDHSTLWHLRYGLWGIEADGEESEVGDVTAKDWLKLPTTFVMCALWESKKGSHLISMVQGEHPHGVSWGILTYVDPSSQNRIHWW